MGIICKSNMKLLVHTLSLISFINAAPHFNKQNPTFHEFLAWKTRHNITFANSLEDQKRFKIYDQNRDLIHAHNERYEQGLESYWMGFNKFAAMEYEEFARKYLTPRPVGAGMLEYKCPHTFVSDGSEVPLVLSYSQGKTCYTNDESQCLVTPIWTTSVKEQGNCGSCWTFGTAAAIESNLCKQERYDCTTWSGVSAQEFVDCASHTSRASKDETYVYNLSPYDNAGCNGGFQPNALRYVMMNQDSMMSWDDYPYTAGDKGRGGECQYDPNTAINHVMSSCSDMSKCSESDMANALVQQGVLTTGIDASGPQIMLFSGGVYKNNLCRSSVQNHAITVSGFGVYPFPTGDAYWEIKNSWGTDWGMDGYMMLSKDTGDQCGITEDVQYVLA